MARRTVKSADFDKTLRTIEERQRELGELRGQLGVRRSRFLPVTYFDESDKDARTRAAAEAEALAQLDEQVQELAVEVETLWEKAAGLQDAAGRLEGDDDEIQQEIGALEQRRQELDAVHRNNHREDSHDAVDGLLRFHRERLDALLAAPSIGPSELELIFAAWPARDPDLAKALHDVVDARQDFAPGSRTQYMEQAALLARQIARRRAELDLRVTEREAQEAEEERQAAEERLRAVEA